MPLKTVCLIPYVEYAYTRQEYADILSTMGHILEEWLGDTAKPPSVDKASSGFNLPQNIIIDIHDRKNWHDWWLRHIVGCLPTFARLNGLKVNCSSRELRPEIRHYSRAWELTKSLSHNPAQDDRWQWQDKDVLPPVAISASSIPTLKSS